MNDDAEIGPGMYTERPFKASGILRACSTHLASDLLTIGTQNASICSMDGFDWDEAKNELLQRTRGVGCEDVIFHIQNGDILDIVRHTNESRYPDQRIVVLNMDGYAYLVPYVGREGVRFLKTIIPSRKATREYLR